MVVEILPPGEPSASVLAGLAGVLLDAVADGASVGFLADLTELEAREWWRTSLQQPLLLTWVARDGDRIIGTVGLIPSTYPNGAHRAEVTKFLVRRDARGLGHGRALIAALESTALAMGRRLLLLDTETGSYAEALYARWGWQRFGVVEGHSATPDGQLAPTTFMVKRL